MEPKDNKHDSIKILLAGSSPAQTEPLRLLLEGHGFSVVVVANGKEALVAARQHKPTLIISDIVMPELDGYGLCQAIKLDTQLKDVPVILLTALADTQDILLGLENKVDDFIHRPYDAEFLLSLLSRIDYALMSLNLHRKMQTDAEISFGGQRHFITSDRQKILDLLISTHERLARSNDKLKMLERDLTQADSLNDEFKKRVKDLLDSNDMLNGLCHIADGLNQAVSQHQVAEIALKRVLELPGIQAGWIFLQEGESSFRLIAAQNLPPALEVPGAMEVDCMCQRRLQSEGVNYVTNIMECERLGKAKDGSHEPRSHASIPLWLGDRTLGLMNLTGLQDGLFDAVALKVLHGVGNRVAVALERAQLHGNLEQLVEQRTAALATGVVERKEQEMKVAHLSRVYAVLSGINTTIIRASSQQRLFEDACRIAVEQGKFRMARIGLFDSNGAGITAAAKAGFDEGYLDATQFFVRDDSPDSSKLVSLVLREKATVVCNDIFTDPWMTQWRDEALLRGYHSMAVFPLQAGNKVVGLFLLYAAEANFFDTEEIRLLSGVAENVSCALDHLEKEKQINYLAYHDVLTGLPNRTLLRDRLDQRIVTARHDQKMFAVVMLNLERFRNVNETLGQRAGDELLRQVARRLRGALDETDILSRLDADSFAIVTGYCDDDSSVGHILESVLSCIHEQVFEIDGNELRISMQAGVAIFPIDAGDADALCRNAEAALGKAKLSGDRYLFYTRELNARVAEKLTLENKLRRALERGQMALYYQPKINLRKQQVSGLEALMRWNDPDMGLVLPQKFIPILEETGLILEAGRWALQQAMADFRRWKGSGLQVPRIAVNVSALQLRQKDFVATVERTLNGSKDVAGALEIEITESLIMQDVEANIRKLQAVREMGVKIAVDDFGTGYSSLTYIARLPIHVLKIDRAFIMNMTTNRDDLNIVSTIISLGHSLRLKIVAEGVEIKEQADLLRLLKCDEFQGDLFSPAVSAEQIEAFLMEKKVAHG